jgi:hypothetical protein
VIRIDHAIHGDRGMITAEFPVEALTSVDRTATITLDGHDWFNVAKRVLREYNAIERGLDAEVLGNRVEHSLRNAVARALSGECDPDLARRRAVAGVLHRLADMVISGTIRELQTQWHETMPEVSVEFGTRQVRRSLGLVLEAPTADRITP